MKFKEISLLANVTGLGRVYRFEEGIQFDDFLEVVENETIPSASQICHARIHSEDLHMVTTIREGIVYSKKKNPLIFPNSPTIYNPKSATNAHREDIEYHIADQTLENAIYIARYQASHRGPLERNFFFVPHKEDFTISRQSLIDFLPSKEKQEYSRNGIDGSNLERCLSISMEVLKDTALVENQSPETKFAINLFKQYAIAYALFCKRDLIVKLVPEYIVNQHERPFVRELSLAAVQDNSSIEGNFSMLNEYERRIFIRSD